MNKKSKKHTLLLDVEETYRMIGICSHHSDYRLVWGINNELHLDLEKSKNPFFAYSKKGGIQSEHSFYTFLDETNQINFYLIKNKSLNHFLIPEKQELDYFLFICDDHYDLLENIIQKLRNVSSVLTVVELDPSTIKSTEQIQFN